MKKYILAASCSALLASISAANATNPIPTLDEIAPVSQGTNVETITIGTNAADSINTELQQVAAVLWDDKN